MTLNSPPQKAAGHWRKLLVALLTGSIAIFLTGSCRSLHNPDLEIRLGQLQKNAALRPISRLPFRADLGQGEQDLELIYHHARAQQASGNYPIVLVHGTPSTLFSWTETTYGSSSEDPTSAFAGLRTDHDVYAIEIIGHGMAPGSASPYGFERCARFVSAAIRALKLPKVHLVGSSYGGEFAWRAALNEPERIASLSLIDSSGVRRRPEDWLSEELVMRDNSLARLGWILNSRERITAALEPHFRGIPNERVEEFFLVCENAENWKAMVDLARDENGDREQELNQLRAPTLLLWGAEDLAYPPDHYAQRFFEAIPNATLEILGGTGHYPHEEQPAEVVRLLKRFFKDLRESSK